MQITAIIIIGFINASQLNGIIDLHCRHNYGTGGSGTKCTVTALISPIELGMNAAGMGQGRSI